MKNVVKEARSSHRAPVRVRMWDRRGQSAGSAAQRTGRRVQAHGAAAPPPSSRGARPAKHARPRRRRAYTRSSLRIDPTADHRSHVYVSTLHNLKYRIRSRSPVDGILALQMSRWTLRGPARQRAETSRSRTATSPRVICPGWHRCCNYIET